MTLFDVLCPLNNFQTFEKINHTHKTQIKYASNIKIKNIVHVRYCLCIISYFYLLFYIVKIGKAIERSWNI